jgi:histone-lysine N-methyltransferase SETMAR
MLTVFWSPRGFFLTEALPKGQTFNSQYYSQTILHTLSRRLPPLSGFRKHLVHVDNASPHRSQFTMEHPKKFRFKSVPHPPFSPDLAPSDFYLFGTIKGKRQGKKFATPDDLVSEVISIVAFISRTELAKAFDEWERRLKRCIELGGDYVD